MEEFELIERLTHDLPRGADVVTGPGDDCAVLDLGIPGQYLLFKTDAVVQGVHFDSKATPQQIGHKALGRCLSDIAAMGGTPSSAVVTLGLPSDYDPDFVQQIYAGARAIAGRFDVSIVGGETTASPGGMFISVAMIGSVEKERCIHRSGAKVGDALFVTGSLGGSILGKHLDFEPRVREARWLVEHFQIHAMLDLSDGLAGDLRHLLKSSACGVEIRAASIPISRAAKLRRVEDASAPDPLAAALSDGEDFELLFAIASKDAVPLIDGWKLAFPDVPVTCIGKFTGEPGLRIRDKDGVREIATHGHIHFKKS